MNGLWEAFQADPQAMLAFLGPALIIGLAMAISGGSLGVLVLLRREAMVALALPQVVILGVAVGLRYLTLEDEPTEMMQWIITHTGWPTLPAAVVAVAIALVLIAAARTRHGDQAGTSRAGIVLLPSLFVSAICVAMLVVTGSGNHLVDVQTRFVGVDVAVDSHLAEISTPVLLACGVIASLLWRRWLLMAQSPAAAQIAGLRPARWDWLFLCLLASTILVGTNALGVVMVLALLFLPAASVLPWVRRVPSAIIAATALGVLTYACGFVISNEYSWSLSHSVGGLGAAIFLLSYLASLLR